MEGELIKKSGIYATIALTFLWVLLREEFSVSTVIIGFIVSAACMFYSQKYLPLEKIADVNFFKLIFYPIYLLGQIYWAGFYVIKIILTGAKIDIVEIDTKIKSNTLRVILADSITLTPGSILLDLTDDKITLVWLRPKNSPVPCEGDGDKIKGHMEKTLLKAQKA